MTKGRRFLAGFEQGGALLRSVRLQITPTSVDGKDAVMGLR